LPALDGLLREPELRAMGNLLRWMNAGLNDQPFTVIFRRALPFVYGLTNSGQKPERQQYTDTD